MRLSKQNILNIKSAEIAKPNENVFDLPIKVLQFGTGVLLRGLPDYLIDKANRQGIFNGRIVVIKSTSLGDATAFEQQDGLYTLAIKGIENGMEIEDHIICSAISHVWSAAEDWNAVLKEIRNPELKIIVSNTTEVGIQLVKEDIHQLPPASFPAKLLALLYARYKTFNGNLDSGFVIVPTELLPDNGKVLKRIIAELIEFNQLDAEFKKWVDEANYFCNSLVDRIVPGKPNADDIRDFEKKAGYKDELLTVSEVYRLWAIEGDEKIRSILSFEKADEGMVIVPDIEAYRELKLRLLNGTHTLSCAFALLSGFETVKGAMDDVVFVSFMERLMTEISSAIAYPVGEQEAREFCRNVLERFRNPYISHLWINIAQQYTTKLKMRILPVLVEFYRKYNKVPQEIAIGFAAYLVFMRPVKSIDGVYFGEYNQKIYPIKDDQADYFFHLVKNGSPLNTVAVVLSNQTFWDADLTKLDGFADSVQKYYDQILLGNTNLVVN
jgi:tagaturonate reductase